MGLRTLDEDNFLALGLDLLWLKTTQGRCHGHD